MIKFLLADDHQIVRDGLKYVLQLEFTNAEVLEANNQEECLVILNAQPIDILFLDLNMPDSDPIKLIQAIRTIQPSTHVIILTMNEEYAYASRFLKLGAKGYLTKSANFNEIISATNIVLSKGVYISDRYKESLINDIIWKTTRNPFEVLTDREFAILQDMLSGKRTKEICSDQSIQLSTVSTFKAKIYDKLKIKRGDFVKLLELAKKAGLIKEFSNINIYKNKNVEEQSY